MWWWRGDHKDCNQKALINGDVRALFRAKKLPFSQVTRTHTTLPEQEWKLESRRERGDISRDLDKNSNILKMSQECHYHAWGHVAGYAEHILCFDLQREESAVKSTPLPEDWPLLLTTAGVRKILLRLNVNDILQDNHIIIHKKTCITEEYKMPVKR